MFGGLFRRVLGACTVLVLGNREASDPVVRDLQRRVQTLEDDLEHERRERKLLAGEVEAQLDQATRRYSKARAAEARAEGVGANGKTLRYRTPAEFAQVDPEGFDRWVGAGRPPGFVGG